MFKKLKYQITVPFVAVMAILGLGLWIAIPAALSYIVNNLEDERIASISQAARTHFEIIGQRNLLAARTIGGSDTLADFMDDWNAGINRGETRLTIERYLLGRMDELGVTAFTVADSAGYVVLRTHERDRYGDLSSLTMRTALAGETIYAFSSSSAPPIGLVSASPIYSRGEIIGSIAAILHIAAPEFVDDFAATFNAEVSVFAGSTRVATTLRTQASDRAVGTDAPPHVTEAVLEGNANYETLVNLYGERQHHAYYFPLRNLAGDAVGMFFVAFSREHALSTINIFRNITLVIMVALIIALTIGLSLLTGRIFRPLAALTHGADEIARGNISVDLHTGAKNELGQLARSFMRIVETLAMLREDFAKAEWHIQEGETFYRMDNPQFQGIFKEIEAKANSVITDIEVSLDLLTTPYFLIDRSMTVRHLNSAARKLIGAENTDWQRAALGTHIDRLLNADISGNAATVSAFATQTLQSEEIRLEVNGQRYIFIYYCSPYAYENSAGAALLLSDITELRETQTSIERLNAERSEKVQAAAETGNRYVAELATAMDEIRESTEEIVKVVQTIESLSRQTNLLSLNASVETARAGEAGRAFAVVAGEVRSLAERSSSAAKETSEMLANSMTRVAIGVAKSEQTGEALRNIIDITLDAAGAG